jgi:hypothetical protein
LVNLQNAWCKYKDKTTYWFGGSTLSLYSGGVWFKFWLVHWLPWVKFLLFFLNANAWIISILGHEVTFIKYEALLIQRSKIFLHMSVTYVIFILYMFVVSLLTLYKLCLHISGIYSVQIYWYFLPSSVNLHQMSVLHKLLLAVCFVFARWQYQINCC